MHFNVILGVLSVLSCGVHSARILGVFHAPAYSHRQIGDKLMYELAARGHEVTLISPFLPKTPIKNLKTVFLDFDLENRPRPNMFELMDMGIIMRVLWLDVMGLMLTEMTLNQTSVQDLLKSDQKFDLVIMEQFVNEAFRGFCYHYNAPCIMVSAIGACRWTNLQAGNPASPSYVPDSYLSLSSNMNFWERLYNTVVYTGAELFNRLYTFRKHNELVQKYFPNAPHLNDLYYNASLILLNSDVSTNSAVPHVPNMIEIGGYHVNEPKKLPKDLQDYLDGAKDGAIFFSMGSNLQSKEMAPEKRDAILKVFSKLKQKILWKWEDETLPGQPSNVRLGKWLPQQDILAHPNIKLFITHGGLLSTIETIYHGVPIVGIPIFGDQEMNVANAEIMGYGVGVPYKQLTENTFEQALDKVLNDPKYTENSQRRSKIMHDQPMKSLDRAVFWVEYALRHEGAPHLRTAALNLDWYQYLLLDVIIFILLFATVFIFVLYKSIRIICGSKKGKTVKKEKKNN